YLRDNDGYDDEGGILWEGVVAYAAAHHLPLQAARTDNTGDAASAAICSKGPTIIPVKHTEPGSKVIHHHFVTAWARDTAETTYLLKDPHGTLGEGGGIAVSLDDTIPPYDYNGNYFGTRELQGPGATFVFSGDVTIVLHSPAELLLTNSAGQRTGIDPITNTTFSEIPNAAYV